LRRCGLPLLGLPQIAIFNPSFIRFFEPTSVQWNHGLAKRLHLAHLVLESLAVDRSPVRSNFLSLISALAVEFVSIPFRLLLSGIFK